MLCETFSIRRSINRETWEEWKTTQVPFSTATQKQRMANTIPCMVNAIFAMWARLSLSTVEARDTSSSWRLPLWQTPCRSP